MDQAPDTRVAAHARERQKGSIGRLGRIYRAAARHHSFQLLLIAFLTAAPFLPLIGHGFVHDDFLHLKSATTANWLDGLTRAQGGPFYTPLTWLTFRLDYLTWGPRPFPLAAENLLIHVLNILLVGTLAEALWQEQHAGLWAAFAFTLLYPANTWAVLWVATRAHLLATSFYLATLISIGDGLKTRSSRFHLGATVCCATCAIFAKESGLTVVVATLLVAWYRASNAIPRQTVDKLLCFLNIMSAVLALYAHLRQYSGAVPLQVGSAGWYSYTLSATTLLDNLLHYCWRTFGLLEIPAALLSVGHKAPRFSRVNSRSMAWRDLCFAGLLFALMVSPFLLLKARSGIYTYLPGSASALLFGRFMGSRIALGRSA